MSKASDFEEELKKELPRFYDSIREFNELVKVDAKHLAIMDDWVEESVDQTFIETATWFLPRWEEVFGIPTDASKPIDQRRSIIKSKIRGAGVTTVDMIKRVASSWFNGDIGVTEEGLKVIIEFNSSFGVPSNIADAEKYLKEIIPAHLLVEFVFLYVSYTMLQDQYATYADIAADNITYSGLLVNEGGA